MFCVHAVDELLSTASHEAVGRCRHRGGCLNRDDDSSEAPYDVHGCDGIADGLPGRNRCRDWEFDLVGFRAIVLTPGVGPSAFDP